MPTFIMSFVYIRPVKCYTHVVLNPGSEPRVLYVHANPLHDRNDPLPFFHALTEQMNHQW